MIKTYLLLTVLMVGMMPSLPMAMEVNAPVNVQRDVNKDFRTREAALLAYFQGLIAPMQQDINAHLACNAQRKFYNKQTGACL